VVMAGRLSPISSTSSTPNRVPIRVPTARNRLFSSSMPRTGWDTAHTVMADHCGCSSPSSQAISMARPEARAVRRAVFNCGTLKPIRVRRWLMEAVLLILSCTVEQTDPLLDQCQGIKHLGQLLVTQIDQHLVLDRQQVTTYIVY